jgi:hypothetical protein
VIIYIVNIQRLFSVAQKQCLFSRNDLHFPTFLSVLSIIGHVTINAGVKIQIIPIYFAFVVWPLYVHYSDDYTRRVLFFVPDGC